MRFLFPAMTLECASLRALMLLSTILCVGVSLLPAQEVPANPEPQWWRGNLHTHSLWSDGDDFPEMIVEWYKKHGYHFLALSDHNVLSTGQRWMSMRRIDQRAQTNAFEKYMARFGNSWVETRGAEEGAVEVRLKPIDEYRTLVEEPRRFLLIQSEELTGDAGDGRALHMNATNLGEQLDYQVGATIVETIVRNLQAVDDSARRTGREVMLHLNHPNYKWGVTAEDLAAAVDEHFFEVWNGVANDNDPGDALHPSTDTMWDIANTLRIVRYKARPLYGLATDDSHDHHDNKDRARPGRGWVMVRARHLTPESIIQAMRRGDFYATTGVVIADVRFDESSRTLSLQLQQRPGERLVTRFVGTRRGASIQGKDRLDARNNPLYTTLDYRTGTGPQIGEVFAEVEGASPSYRMKDDELYVRAVVTSNLPPEVPSPELAAQKAWTQPVGW